jgi:hypothetical protein
MNGERKAILFTVGLIVLCLTIIVVLLFWSLWPERELVAYSVLSVGLFIAITMTIVPALGKINEMAIRHKRYHHHEETPLDEHGNPLYMPAGSQVYPRQIVQPQEIRMYDYE